MRAALYDFDGTLRPRDSIVEWVAYARKRGVISVWEWLRITCYAAYGKVTRMEMRRIKSRALRFEGGLTRAQIRRLARDFTREVVMPKVTREGLASWERDGQEGYVRLLVSASTSDYMPDVSRAMGADMLICTEVSPEGIVAENCRGPVKAQRLKEWRDSLPESDRPDFAKCRAYGNSTGDIDMLALCGEAHLIGNSRKALKACSDRGIHVIRGFARP